MFPGVSTNVSAATSSASGVVQIDQSLNIIGGILSSRTARFDAWVLTNAYRLGESVTYTDGRFYVANSIIAASTAFVVGTAANTWTLVGPVLVTAGAASTKATTTYTIALTDFMLRGNAASGNQVYTLPTSASAFVNGIGQIFHIKKVDSSANTVTLQANGTELIDGVTVRAPALTSQYATVAVISNGTGWDVI